MSGQAGYANCRIMGCFLENTMMQGTVEKKNLCCWYTQDLWKIWSTKKYLQDNKWSEEKH